MPLQMRLPKRGFKNRNRVSYIPFNLSRLQLIAEKYNLKAIGVEELVKLGIVGKEDKVKILANGELKAKLKVTAHACSAKAKEAIESKGGQLNLV